jgi:hypothetical protein
MQGGAQFVADHGDETALCLARLLGDLLGKPQILLRELARGDLALELLVAILQRRQRMAEPQMQGALCHRAGDGLQ